MEKAPLKLAFLAVFLIIAYGPGAEARRDVEAILGLDCVRDSDCASVCGGCHSANCIERKCICGCNDGKAAAEAKKCTGDSECEETCPSGTTGDCKGGLCMCKRLKKCHTNEDCVPRCQRLGCTAQIYCTIEGLCGCECVALNEIKLGN